MFDNLQLLPAEIWIFAIAFVVIVSTSVFYIWRKFEVSELTPAPPFVKLAKKKNAEALLAVSHNVPQPNYTQGRFIDRDNEIEEIARVLRPYPDSQHHLVSIVGVGGVGKTTLALEVVHKYIYGTEKTASKERFQSIVWISAQQKEYRDKQFVDIENYPHTLEDLLSKIYVVLHADDDAGVPRDKRIDIARNALTLQRTLLIIDNLDTFDEGVQYFLLHLPAPTKVIITSRYQVDSAYPIQLTGLEWKYAKVLIEQMCQQLKIELDGDSIKRLYDKTQGLPLAIVWTISQLESDYTITEVLAKFSSPTTDIVRFCFEQTIKRIEKRPAYKLLLALSMFSSGVPREALEYVAGLAPQECVDGLSELKKKSLVTFSDKQYDMLSLTREYAKALFAQETPLNQFLEQRFKEWTGLELPFPKIAVSRSRWWQGISTTGITAYVGRDQHGELVEFSLNAERGSIHTLVSGRTGYGKSNFVNVFLMNTMLAYPPDELKIWLFDSQGVYEQLSQFHLPHIEMIAIGRPNGSSDFYKDRLKDLWTELSRRRAMFDKMPLLVVVDGFKEVVGDPVEANESFRLLTQIIRLGRASRIHLILVRKSPEEFDADALIKNVGEGTLSQVSNLVVFKSYVEETRKLLNESAEAVRGFEFPGEALISIPGKSPIYTQIARLTVPNQRTYLKELSEFAQKEGIVAETRVFDDRSEQARL